MTLRLRHPRAIRATLLVVAAALTLSACGRKGGLDLPPGASAQTASSAPATADAAPAQQGGSLFNPNFNENAPAASKGRKKPFILDPLLD